MKRKIVIPVFVVSFLFVSLLSSLMLQNLFADSKKSEEKFLYGRIIFVADNYIEIKKGKIEYLIYFADNTKFISKDGKDVAKNILNVCQYVDAYYSDGAKKILNKIIIKKESDCVK